MGKATSRASKPSGAGLVQTHKDLPRPEHSTLEDRRREREREFRVEKRDLMELIRFGAFAAAATTSRRVPRDCGSPKAGTSAVKNSGEMCFNQFPSTQ